MKAFPFLFLFNIFSPSSSWGLYPAICCALWPSSSKALKHTNNPGFGGKWATERETLPCVQTASMPLCFQGKFAACFPHCMAFSPPTMNSISQYSPDLSFMHLFKGF